MHLIRIDMSWFQEVSPRLHYVLLEIILNGLFWTEKQKYICALPNQFSKDYSIKKRMTANLNTFGLINILKYDRTI